MIVDTSAIIAILRGEPDADQYITALATDAQPLISSGTYLETAIVIDSSRDPILSGRLDDLLSIARIRIESVTKEHAEIARQAYRNFGRCSGHPARLNLGDCFAYALSRATRVPLLYKGDDFANTDIEPALRGTNGK